MLGAKIGALFGSRFVFQAMVVLFGAAIVIMTLSPSATMMIVAQGIAGAAAAALIPTLVVLIATNYKGKQQAQPLGWLGGGHGRRVCVSGRRLSRHMDRLALPFGLLDVLSLLTALFHIRLSHLGPQKPIL